MVRIYKRLAIALFLSLACFALTTYWYEKTGDHSVQNNQQQAVAFLTSNKDETLRRPVTRVIWQSINGGEALYSGEAIRTSADGEARIQFVDSGRFIDLEPDSMIVISVNVDREISLDLLDGRVTVNQGDALASSDAPALTLKSGASTIDLTRASASLTKNDSGQVDLQVLAGKANVEENGKLQQIDSRQIKILSPLPGEVFYFNPKDPKPVGFSWQGFPAGTKVSIEMGSRRQELNSKAETLESQIAVNVPAGKVYWKLVGQDPSTGKVVGESALFRLEVTSRLGLELKEPSEGEVITPELAKNLELKWERPLSAVEVRAELFESMGADAKPVSIKTFKEESSWNQEFANGDHFVRLSVRFQNSSQWLMGPVRRFRVSAKPLPPKIAIDWLQPVQGAIAYFGKEPSVNLSWSRGEGSLVPHWRVKVAASEVALDGAEARTAEVDVLNAQVPLPSAGKYFAVIEALDSEKRVFAKSSIRSFKAEVMPLLAAIDFEGPKDLKAQPSGRLDLKWNAVDGAREYEVTLYDKDGQELKTTRLQKNMTALERLLPGEFKVGVTAIDEHGRSGAKAKARIVRVPATSGLSKPKVRTLKVQ